MAEAPTFETGNKALYELLIARILNANTPQLKKLRGMPDDTVRGIIQPGMPNTSHTGLVIDKWTAESLGLQPEMLVHEVMAATGVMLSDAPVNEEGGAYQLIHLGRTFDVLQKLDLSKHAQLQVYREKMGHHETLLEKRGKQAVHWAQIAQGKEWINDTYFAVTELAKHKFPWSHEQFEHHGDEDTIVNAVVKELQSMGIRRLGVLCRGGFSTVFETVPDKEGRMQLVTLLSYNDKFIDHPCFVPAKEMRTVEAGENKVMIIVSPKLSTHDVTDEHVKELIGRFRKSGLEDIDLQQFGTYLKRNVALYRERPNDKPIAFCVDRGAVRWPPHLDTDDQAMAMMRWDDDGTLDGHRAVHQKYHHTGLENIRLTPPAPEGRHALPMLKAEARSCATIDQADKKDITPGELSSMSLDAMSASRNSGEWVKKLRQQVADFDPSSHPDSRPPRRR